jgi:hypothetical protein
MGAVMEEEYGLGWLMFASIVLVIAGIMRIFDAIWAWRYNGTLDGVPEELEDAIFGSDLATYGWLWLIVGVILILAGFAVFQRSQWARWIGVFAGAVMAISAVAWMPYYPIWSFMYIMIGIFVVYGLAAYGGRAPSSTV